MRGFTIPREGYLPKGAPWTFCEFPEAQVALYRYDLAGKFYALAFFGKQGKPAFHYSFRSEENRAAYVRRIVEGQTASVQHRLERAAKRAAFQHSLEVGSILRTSWGYDQTNVEFFEVVEVLGKSVRVRELAQQRNETGYMQGTCRPIPGKYIGPAILKRVCEGNTLKMSDWGRYASACTGETSAHWSSYA